MEQHPYTYLPPLHQQQQQQQQQHQSPYVRPLPLHQTAWSTAAPGATSSSQPPPSFPPRDPAPTPAAAVKGKAPKRAPPPSSQAAASETGGSEPEKKKRKRTGFACLACRKRRTKCDGAQPCSACGQDDEECCYPDAKVSVKYVQELEAKVRELEHAASAAAHDRSSLSSSAAISPQPPESVFSAPLLPSTVGAPRPSPSGAAAGYVLGGFAGQGHGAAHPSPTLRLPSLRVSTVASTWERTGHDGHAAELIEKAAAILVGQTPPNGRPQLPPLLPSMPGPSQPTPQEPLAGDAEDAPVHLLERHIVDSLLHWYLIRFQYVYPVVHWPTFYGRWADRTFEQSSVHAATLHLVLTISATLRSKKGDEELAARYFARAQLTGAELLLTADLDTLIYLLLLCFYSQSCQKNGLSSNSVAHTIFLARSLIAVDLGALPRTERAMRRRCWGAARQMMATSSAIAYRAATKADEQDTYDSELLWIGGDDDDEALGGPYEGNRLLFFRETIKLFILKWRTLGSRNDPSSLVEHETLLLDFWDDIPPQLLPAHTHELSFTRQLLAVVLRGRYLNTQILLHRPALLESISASTPAHLRRQSVRSALYRTSAQECVGTAIELLDLCASSWFTLMHGSWWFSLGYSYSSCLVILAYQISQRVRGRDVSTFLDPPALDQQASEAVELGLAVLHGLAQLNTPPANSQTPLAESRASPDVIAAADRSHAIILRLRDVLRSSHGALAAGQNALTPRRQDPQAAAAPADMPLFQAWNDGQAIPDFPAVWAGDDEFMDNLLQLFGSSGPSGG